MHHHQPHNITRREKEILLNVCKGLTAIEIAERLHISTSTVESHKKNLCNKFNARNSVQLAVIAANLGHVGIKDIEI